MSQVFVSYASKDIDLAAPIVAAIGQAGLQVWHPGEIGSGGSFGEQVGRALDAAQCVVVLWSNAAAQSHFVQQEIHQAIQAWSSDRLVLATLDDAPLPAGLRDLPAISMRDASDAGTRQLVERALAIVGRGVIAAEPTSSAPTAADHHPAPPARLRLSRLVVAGVVALFAVLVGAAAFLTSLQRAELPSSPPAQPPLPPPGTDLTPAILVLLMVLVLGVAIGAAAVWAWTAQSRRRSSTRSAPSGAMSYQEPNGAPQVFVSYSRQDGRTVDQLVHQIEQLGYAVWIDRQSTGSQRYAAPIVRAIRTSKLVALMCSQNAFASDHVVREVYVAGDYKKPFIAFQLDPTEFPDELLYFVSGFPRVPVATIDPQQLRSELSRLITA